MRVLVYGAGVIGCQLAHFIKDAGSDVVLLARGKWKETLDQRGLVIRNAASLKRSVDYIKTIDHLEVSDQYDLIFVVMTYQHIKEILPDLAANQSRSIIFVGNNAMPEECCKQIEEMAVIKKEIAFAFIGIGGTKKTHEIVGMHLSKMNIIIGGLHEMPSETMCDMITHVFEQSACVPVWQKDMQSWLLTHLAFILPMAYMNYIMNNHLWRTNKQQIDQVIQAVLQVHIALRKAGYQISPEDEDEQIDLNQWKLKKRKKLKMLFKTPAGKFVITNHCKHGRMEMKELGDCLVAKLSETDVPIDQWMLLQCFAGL